MDFNSIPFACFFIVFFLLYWLVFNRSLRLQNLFILLGSYVFYGWWDWRFLILLIGYSLLNYLLGYYIHKAANQKSKIILKNIGVAAGLGALFYFKYTNFFIASFIAAFAKFNVHLNIHTLALALPLGISFYIFRTLSYLFDIKNGKMKPADSWVTFFSFVAFFPTLLSGPIDKAKTLIPQFERKRDFKYSTAIDASRQILWGLFKKLVIADQLADITNPIFDNSHNYPGSTLVLATFYFAVQLYADFSGYSDMAIGLARLIGFEVTRNFNYPFFAQNIAEFWRKWHISLTSWLTEYVFTPLSITFRDYDKWGLIISILINFTLIGIWHGANWTFVLFGLLHGCYYIPLIIKGTINKKKKLDPDKLLPSFSEAGNMLKTFALVSFSFILFRSNSVTSALGYIRQIFSRSIISRPVLLPTSLFIFIILFFVIEWLGKENDYAIAKLGIKWPRVLRWGLYYVLIILIFQFAGPKQQFIYLQF